MPVKRRPEKEFELGGHWLDRVAGSDYWYDCWYDAGAGERRRRSLGEKDFEQAKIELAARLLVEQPKTAETPIAAALEAYCANVTDKKASKKAARTAKALLIKTLGAATPVSACGPEAQRKFIVASHAKGHSVAYVGRNLSVLGAALSGASGAPGVTMAYGEIVQILEAEGLSANMPAPRDWVPSDHELARFIDAIELEHVFRFVMLVLNTAARPEAACELTPAQYDERLRILNLLPRGRRQTKKRRPIVRVTKCLSGWLPRWTGTHFVRDGGITYATVKTAIKRMRADLKLPQLTAYSLRHKIAAELRARGVAPDQRAMQLGHRLPDMRTTDGYGGFDARYLAQAASAIDAYMARLQKLTKRRLFAAKQLAKPKAEKLPNSAKYLN